MECHYVVKIGLGYWAIAFSYDKHDTHDDDDA